MNLNIVAIVCFSIISIEVLAFRAIYQYAAHEVKSTQELMKSFVEFLHEDKEIGAALEKILSEPSQIRNRRQAENVDGMMDVDNINTEDVAKDGFFDRATKFVMEVLQRFLKWINTDN